MSALLLVALAFLASGVFVLLAYRRQWQWTGLPAARIGGAEVGKQPAKTLWDWLQLLGIPVVLVALAFLLNDKQTRRDQQREERREAQQLAVAADAARENTLRDYLAQMSDLLLDRRLLRSTSTDARNVARTATLTAVRRLDGVRRGLIVQFLVEARVISLDKPSIRPLSIDSAEFAHADLVRAELSKADLSGANFHRATFSGSDLTGSDLSRANLRGANCHDAIFSGANLREVDLRGANLGDADLSGADLSGAANLSGADLSEADLSEVDLSGSDLSEVDLGGADLSGANLSGADLSEANIADADFRGVRGAELAEARGTPTHGP